jgi:hypothetical protein
MPAQAPRPALSPPPLEARVHQPQLLAMPRLRPKTPKVEVTGPICNTLPIGLLCAWPQERVQPASRITFGWLRKSAPWWSPSGCYNENGPLYQPPRSSRPYTIVQSLASEWAMALTIGRRARATGVGVQTIRYHERGPRARGMGTSGTPLCGPVGIVSVNAGGGCPGSVGGCG